MLAGSAQHSERLTLKSHLIKSDSFLMTALMASANDEGRLSPHRAYKTVSWVRAALRYRSGQIASIPFEITQGSTVVYDSQAGDVAKGFAWHGKLQHLLKLIDSSVALEGMAFIRKFSESGNKIDNLYWYQPDKTKPIPFARGEGRGIKAFEHETGGVPEMIDPEEMVFISPLDVYSELWNEESEYMAAKVNAEIMGNLNAFLSGHLSRDMLKATLFYVPKGTKAEEVSVLDSWIKDNLMGARSRKKYAIMQAESVKHEMVGEGIGDLHNTKIEEMQIKQIAAALCVPPSVVDSSASHFSVSKQDALQFMQLTGKPAMQVYSAELNAQLFEPLGQQMTPKYELVEQFQEQQLDQAERVAKLYQAGLWTREESRIATGKPEVPENGGTFMEHSPVAVNLGRSLTHDAMREMETWKRKIDRRGRDTEFTTQYIPNEIADTIRFRLKSNEPIGATFSPPWN